jgi:hypothetical protein
MAKTKRPRSIHVLPEPKWDSYKDLTDPQEQHKAFQDALYWIHYEIPEKKGVMYIKRWMRYNWPEEVFHPISKLPDSYFYGWSKYGYAWFKLGWMPKDSETYFHSLKDKISEDAASYVEEKEVQPKVVNIRENLDKFAMGVDDSIERIIKGTQITNYKDLVESFNLNKAETEQAVAIVDDFAMEFRELAEGTDEQLLEGYSHVKKSTLRHLLAFFDGLPTALMETQQAKKITRIRRKRPVDKTKLVRRLKYTKQHEQYKSIDPVEIIGASEVWVYDIKRKRIGVYASDYANTLGVKGTVIDNYSLTKSYEKTVRKEELVKSFMECRKNSLHGFMDKIRGKKFPAKSRVQATMVLLRVIK